MMERSQISRATWLGSLLVLSSLGTPSAQAGSLSWSQFWELARASNPKVRALKVQREQIQAQVALEVPPPTVAIGSMGMNGPTSGTMERTFEVSQRVPFPSKFATANRLKDVQIRKQEFEVQTALLEIKKDAFSAFVDLSELLKDKELILEKQHFFAGHLKRLKAYTVSDQIQQLHILEMESEQKSIEAELKQIQGAEQGLRLRLGALVSDSGEPFAQEPLLDPIDLNRSVPHGSLAENPGIKLSQSIEEVRSRETSLAKTAWLPDLSLTYRRHVRLDNVMPSSHEVVLGIELPFLFGWQASSKTEAAHLTESQASLETAQRLRDARADSESLQARLESTREQIRLMRNDILPNLEKRMHLLHRLAQTDMESLDLHRTTYEQVLNGQQKNLKLESQYRKDWLELETLQGGVE